MFIIDGQENPQGLLHWLPQAVYSLCSCLWLANENLADWNQEGSFFIRKSGMESGVADLPRQHTQNKVQHKKGADDDEGDEVQPVPCVASRIICLEKRKWDKKANIYGHINGLAPGRTPQKGPGKEFGFWSDPFLTHRTFPGCRLPEDQKNCTFPAIAQQ